MHALPLHALHTFFSSESILIQHGPALREQSPQTIIRPGKWPQIVQQVLLRFRFCGAGAICSAGSTMHAL